MTDAVSDFSPWLQNRSKKDTAAKKLQDFAVANAASWPTGSNNLADYRAALSSASQGPARDELFLLLGQYFGQWIQEGRSGSRGGFIGLIAGGIILAIFLAWGLYFSPTFLSSLAQVEQARGLITFLFAFATIGIMILIAISLLWVNNEDIEPRFTKAKDFLTILVGLLGTIIGFYFGSPSSKGEQPTAASAQKLSVAAISGLPASVAPGDLVTISTSVAGGVAPYQYEIQFSDPANGPEASKLNVGPKNSAVGDVKENITIPGDISKSLDLTIKVLAKDSKGTAATAPEGKLKVEKK